MFKQVGVLFIVTLMFSETLQQITDIPSVYPDLLTCIVSLGGVITPFLTRCLNSHRGGALGNVLSTGGLSWGQTGCVTLFAGDVSLADLNLCLTSSGVNPVPPLPTY